MGISTKRAFNPERNKGMNLESILSAPLIAAATANSMMLKEQTQFLMDFCFSKNGDSYDPVMIQMSLTNSVLEPGKTADDEPYIRSIQTVFNLPLITIIPINSLAVDNVAIEFDMEITSQYAAKTDDSQSISRNSGTTNEKAQLMGKVSYDSKENANRDNQSNYRNNSVLKVNINASPLPLPVGLTTILNLYVKSVMPLQQSKA